MRYATKRLVVEAVQYELGNCRPAFAFCRPHDMPDEEFMTMVDCTASALWIETGDVMKRVKPGDYIVRHADGKFKAYDKDAFESAFEVEPL